MIALFATLNYSKTMTIFNSTYLTWNSWFILTLISLIPFIMEQVFKYILLNYNFLNIVSFNKIKEE